MKWLIISCALILYSVSLTSAESEEITDQYRKCNEEWNNQSQAETECIKEQFDGDEFEIELNATFIGGSNEDPNAVRTFGDKYCPKLNHSIYCFPIAFNVSTECLAVVGGPRKLEEMAFQNEIAAKFLAYACDNNSSALVRVAVNGGFDMIDVKKLITCMDLDNVRFADQNSVTLRVNPLFCDSVSKSVDCYLDYLRDHRNQELIQITNEVHALARDMLKC